MFIMTEDSHFLRETVVDIDAAVVGVSSARWTAILETEATAERAAEIMKANRFDTLPIESEKGIKEYFQTDTWNHYSSIARRAVIHRDVIPYKTPLRNVIQGFTSEARNFYFLSNERRIVGLISVANLNCRQVKVYLFSLLSELEIQLGNLVSLHCQESELLAMTFGASDNPKFAEVKARYHADKTKGVDVPFVEYLFLSDLINVIAKKQLYNTLGCQSRKQFEQDFGPLIKLRDAVAHPTRSIISDADSCKKVWERIDRIEGVLFALQ
jgi:hypothetical protein